MKHKLIDAPKQEPIRIPQWAYHADKDLVRRWRNESKRRPKTKAVK